jgi:hypothetical protein
VDSALLAELRAQLEGGLETIRLLGLMQAGCAVCGRRARELVPWEEDGVIVEYLGPTCHRRRIEAEHDAPALDGFRPVRTTEAFQKAGLL